MESTLTDRSYRVFATPRSVRFTEMEYAIPREHAVEAIRAVRELVESRELAVSFPFEVRFVKGDDAFLSPAGGRDTCYIASHVFEGMEYEPFMRGVEEIMDGFGGRPHWGKRHFQTAETLRPRYPEWDRFDAVRERLDPEGRFANDYVRRVLGPPVAARTRGLSRLPASLPHVALGDGPDARCASCATGLWVKDESGYGTLWGGNKVRKLEFILPDAKRRGKRTILTFGALGHQPRPGHRAVRARAGPAVRDRAGRPAGGRPRACPARAPARLGRDAALHPHQGAHGRGGAVAAGCASPALRPARRRLVARGRPRLRGGRPRAGGAGAGGRAAGAVARGVRGRVGRHGRGTGRWVCGLAGLETKVLGVVVNDKLKLDHATLMKLAAKTGRRLARARPTPTRRGSS